MPKFLNKTGSSHIKQTGQTKYLACTLTPENNRQKEKKREIN